MDVKVRPNQRKPKEMRQKYQIVFGSKEGKEVYQDLLKNYYFQNVYERNDPYHTAFQAGQQNVVWQIIQIIENPIDIDNPEKSETERS